MICIGKKPECSRVFSRPFTHGGGDKALMGGGTHEGGHRPYGGLNLGRLYHKLKVLLLLSCNYMTQFISYDSIKTC